LLLGFAALFGTWVSFIFPLVFLMVANFWYIPVEEKNMAKVFGDDYLTYRSKVRRWI
jgi:protein-S-isoprenylcysteine O-methyltransferase Ste14